MKKITNISLIVTILLLLLVSTSMITLAKDFKAGDKAFTYDLNGNGSNDLGGIFFLNDHFSINPSIYIDNTYSPTTNYTTYILSSGFYYHYKASEIIDIFAGPRISYYNITLSNNNNSIGTSSSQTSISGVLGFQYFINNNFGITSYVGIEYSKCTNSIIDSSLGTFQNGLGLVFYF